MAGLRSLPFFGNQWDLPPGHRLRLDLTQVDNPTFRPSTQSSTIALSDVGPRLPRGRRGP
jgi:hypothetical protein